MNKTSIKASKVSHLLRVAKKLGGQGEKTGLCRASFGPVKVGKRRKEKKYTPYSLGWATVKRVTSP